MESYFFLPACLIAPIQFISLHAAHQFSAANGSPSYAARISLHRVDELATERENKLQAYQEWRCALSPFSTNWLTDSLMCCQCCAQARTRSWRLPEPTARLDSHCVLGAFGRGCRPHCDSLPPRYVILSGLWRPFVSRDINIQWLDMHHLIVRVFPSWNDIIKSIIYYNSFCSWRIVLCE